MKQYKGAECWKPYFEKFREEFEKNLSDEPLASKRNRIIELSKAYHRLSKTTKHLPKAIDAISKIREEIEGKSSNVTVTAQYNQYNTVKDDDLRRIIVENTKFLEIADKRKRSEKSAPPEIDITEEPESNEIEYVP